MDAKNTDLQASAHPASGYRFPPRWKLPDDLTTIEIRLAIIGLLNESGRALAENRGLQETRDLAFRACDLLIALSNRELSRTQGQTKRGARSKSTAAPKRTRKSPAKKGE